MRREIIIYLNQIGVDTRFVSIDKDQVIINNLRFSRFSRRREKIFTKKFPHIKVVRSKIFQKICSRSSQYLSQSLKPKTKIFIFNEQTQKNKTLKLVLEPYTRKYGVEIIRDDRDKLNKEDDIDYLADPLTLDDEVEQILTRLLKGEKIRLLSSKRRYDNTQILYPFLNIPSSWIYSWNGLKYYRDNCSQDMIRFLESIIPDVRENILKSALFLESYN